MKKCTSCGTQLSDEAKICRECGAFQTTDSASDDGFFSMPYLSSSVSVRKTVIKTEAAGSDTADAEEKDTCTDKEKEKVNIDLITDPRERAFAKQDRRNKMLRIAALIVVGVVIIALAVYLITRNTGYHRTLDKYVDGMSGSGGTSYTSIVPDIYLLEAEELYGISRPDIRNNSNNYLKYVKEQIDADYGDGAKFSYKIIAENDISDEGSLDMLETTILSTYGTELNITDIAYVNIRLTTKGSVTQTSESKTLTFFMYDGDWYSLEAMQIIQFACENAGYGLW